MSFELNICIVLFLTVDKKKGKIKKADKQLQY